MKKETLTKEILYLLNNNHTSIENVENIKTNYYNFVTDKIYLANNINDSKHKKGLENANPFCGELVTICHECIHSVQSKWLHILNLILSNLSIIFTIISFILMLFFSKPIWWIVISATIIVLAIFVRLFLEINAITRSVKTADRARETINISGVDKKDIVEARKIINKMMPFQIISMLADKIVMLIIVVI